MTPRPPSHPANVRDLGGLPLVAGGVTRRGVLLRGDAPYAGDSPPPGLTWPPAVVIDLRAPVERAWCPYGWQAETVVHGRDLFDAGDLRRMPELGGLMDAYEAMVNSAGTVVASLVELIAHDGPTLVHCTAGKDRTGVTIAALLLLAGVEVEAVTADYRRTEQAMKHVLARQYARGLLEPGQVRRDWTRAPTQAVQLLVDRVGEWPGGVRGWFVDHGAREESVDSFVEALTARGTDAVGV